MLNFKVPTRDLQSTQSHPGQFVLQKTEVNSFEIIWGTSWPANAFPTILWIESCTNISFYLFSLILFLLYILIYTIWINLSFTFALVWITDRPKALGNMHLHKKNCCCNCRLIKSTSIIMLNLRIIIIQFITNLKVPPPVLFSSYYIVCLLSFIFFKIKTNYVYLFKIKKKS